MITVRPLSIRVDTPNGETVIFPTVIKTRDELILVDAGYPGQDDAIVSAAAKEGFDLQKLTKILLTHHDFDHVGSLKALKTKFPNAEVVAPANEVQFIEGKEKSFRLQQAEAMYASLPQEAKEGARQFEALLKSFAPCNVDRAVKEGDAIDTEGLIIVVETPGHTCGHISLLIPALQTVIAGDAVVYENGELALANAQYAYDLTQAKVSAQKILAFGADTIICYHGGTAPHSATLNLEE